MQNPSHSQSDNLESDSIPKGLSEDIVRLISSKNNEPQWLLDLRLKAYNYFVNNQTIPTWSKLQIEPIDFGEIIYHSKVKQSKKPESLTILQQKWLNTIKDIASKLKN